MSSTCPTHAFGSRRLRSAIPRFNTAIDDLDREAHRSCCPLPTESPQDSLVHALDNVVVAGRESPRTVESNILVHTSCRVHVADDLRRARQSSFARIRRPLSCDTSGHRLNHSRPLRVNLEEARGTDLHQKCRFRSSGLLFLRAPAGFSEGVDLFVQANAAAGAPRAAMTTFSSRILPCGEPTDSGWN